MKKSTKELFSILIALSMSLSFVGAQESETSVIEAAPAEENVEAVVTAEATAAEEKASKPEAKKKTKKPAEAKTAEAKITEAKPAEKVEKPEATSDKKGFLDQLWNKKAVSQKIPEGAKTGKIRLNCKEFEIALHQYDYDSEIKGLNVVFPKDYKGSRRIKWASTDINTVVVDQNGRLFPKAIGNATVVAYTADGTYKASCKVSVTRHGPKPKADVKVSADLWGDSSVTFGCDADTGKCGFATDQKIKLKLNLINLGEIWSDSEGEASPIWGEIRVYTKGDPLQYMVDEKSQGTPLILNNSADLGDDAFMIYVDRAKIHLGNGYITLFDKNETNLGYVDYTTGPDVCYEFFSADKNRRYGQLQGRTLQSYLSSTAAEKSIFGLSAGYKMDRIFDIKADVASTKPWVAGSENTGLDTADINNSATDWVYKLSGTLYLVPGLEVGLGFSDGIIGKDSLYRQDMRFGAQVSYLWNFADIFYLKPKFGCTMVQIENQGALLPLISGGILLSWEDKQNAFDLKFSNVETKYSKDDYGSYPGFALAAEFADKRLANQSVINTGRVSFVDHDMLIVHSSFNTGDNLLVPNLEAVGAVDIFDVLSDSMIIGFTAGGKYSAQINDKISIVPKFFTTRYFDFSNKENDYFYVKAGVDFNYQRVCVSLDYESNDLINGFYDGMKYNKLGKIETTLKVRF